MVGKTGDTGLAQAMIPSSFLSDRDNANPYPVGTCESSATPAPARTDDRGNHRGTTIADTLDPSAASWKSASRERDREDVPWTRSSKVLEMWKHLLCTVKARYFSKEFLI